jgi:hypothetical protein
MSSVGYYYPRPLNAKSQRPNDSFMKHWSESALICGFRHSAGQALNSYIHSPLNDLADLGFECEEIPKSNILGHKEILKLDHEHLEPGQLSKQAYLEQVKHNTERFRNEIKENGARQFFKDVSFKDYAKKTVWGSNVQPIKDLINNVPDNRGMNWAYTGGVALVGLGVVRKAYKAHKYWKKREDGSLSSKWRTTFQTTKATLLKFIQSLGCWEAAGFGMAIGCALLPVTGIPLGGIALGALFSTIAYKAISKLMPSLKKYE